MMTQKLLRQIELHKLQVEASQAELDAAKRAFRKHLRQLVIDNGLNYGVLARRLKCKSHMLTNYFCKEQDCSEKFFPLLIQACGQKLTADEAKTIKQQPRWKVCK